MFMGRKNAAEPPIGGGDVRLLLRRGGGSFTARSLLCCKRRLGEDTGVANAKGGRGCIVEVLVVGVYMMIS